MIRDVTALRRLREWLLRTERLASVGTLATGAAHEINNPLTAVVVNTEFAREAMREIINEAAAALARSPDADPEPLRRLTARSSEIDDALADVSTGAARIAQVVRELKAFASPADDEVSWVEIESVLEAALNLTESQIKQRARLVRDLSDVPPVWGNAARLEELFVSLLVRACASIPPGAADRNEISVTTRAAADGRVVVSVSDSGAAIAKADLARIFDPFASPRGQGDEAVLGMPVCQAIASAYGGEITAESTEGKGSCFSVWLLTMATLRRSSPPRYGAPRAGRIAIIDDEHLGGRALQRALGADHEVVLMQSADEALAQLGRGVRFDLILCDVMMPVMSGVDFHRELVRRYPDQAQRTVFITGGAMTDTVRDYLGRLPNAVLEKPVSTAKLREIAARQVSSHRSSVTPDPDSMRH
jgi:CheY-like chemotaxis protein